MLQVCSITYNQFPMQTSTRDIVEYMPENSNVSVAVLLPCYNEEAVLPETQKELGNKLETMITAGAVSEKSRIIFVDDGSKD